MTQACIHGLVLSLLALPAIPAQESRPTPLFAIGSETGSDGELFANIAGIAIDQHGRIVVLDAREKRLIVFRPSGQRLQYLGRPGAGPGEFQSPVAVSLHATGRVLVLDPQSARLTAYDATRPDSLRYERSWILPLPGYALCVAGARLFVLADANEKLIHELSLEGREAKVLRSFAEPKSHHPVATNFRPLLIFGSQLACSPDGTKVALVPRQLGEVRVFSTVDGRELLFTRLTPFQEIGINAMDRGFRYSNPGGVFQLNVALQVNDRGAVTVQIATYRTAGGRPRPDTFEFRSLSTTGSTMTVRSAHTVLGAVSATRVACTREDPFPQLMVYDRAHLGTQLCP